jgi:hypothetical protein
LRLKSVAHSVLGLAIRLSGVHWLGHNPIIEKKFEVVKKIDSFLPLQGRDVLPVCLFVALGKGNAFLYQN